MRSRPPRGGPRPVRVGRIRHAGERPARAAASAAPRTIISAPSTNRAVASGRSPRSRARNRHSGQAVHGSLPGTVPHSGQRGRPRRPASPAAASSGRRPVSRSATTSSSSAASASGRPRLGRRSARVARSPGVHQAQRLPATAPDRQRNRPSASRARNWRPRWCSAAAPTAARSADARRRPSPPGRRPSGTARGRRGRPAAAAAAAGTSRPTPLHLDAGAAAGRSKRVSRAEHDPRPGRPAVGRPDRFDRRHRHRRIDSPSNDSATWVIASRCPSRCRRRNSPPTFGGQHPVDDDRLDRGSRAATAR